MKNTVKSVLLSSAFVFGVGTSFLIPNAFANTQPQMSQQTKMMKIKRMRHVSPMNTGINSKAWSGVNPHNRHLSAADAKTIAQAALVWHNQRNLMVGQIETKTGKRGNKMYIINIENAQKQVVRRVAMSSRTGKVRLLKLTPTPKA